MYLFIVLCEGICIFGFWTFIFLLVLSQVTSANAFAQTLRRYTSLNHLAQAARAVLQNTAQINQMLSDLNRVDFANVQVGLVSVLCALAAFTSSYWVSVFVVKSWCVVSVVHMQLVVLMKFYVLVIVSSFLHSYPGNVKQGLFF